MTDLEQLLADVPGLITENNDPPETEPNPTPQQNPNPAPTETPTENGENPTEAGEGKENNPAPEPQAPQPDKSARAFAQLRIELSKKEKLMKDLVQALGITSSDKDDEIAKAVKDKVLELQSKAKNIPADVLKELEDLKQAQRESALMYRRNKVTQDLAELQKEFQVDEKGMSTFINALVSDGVNPYEKDVNLKYEYLTRNWQTLLLAAEEKGKNAEAQRALNAQKHSTTPPDTTGSMVDNTGKQKIDSVTSLNAVLDELTPKAK